MSLRKHNPTALRKVARRTPSVGITFYGGSVNIPYSYSSAHDYFSNALKGQTEFEVRTVGPSFWDWHRNEVKPDQDVHYLKSGREVQCGIVFGDESAIGPEYRVPTHLQFGQCNLLRTYIIGMSPGGDESNNSLYIRQKLSRRDLNWLNESDIPSERTKTLLRSYEHFAAHSKTVDVQQIVSSLEELAELPEIRQELFGFLDEDCSSYLKWLTVNLLAKFEDSWRLLAPKLVEVVKSSNEFSEIPFIIGSLIALRNHRVPESYRADLTEALRLKLRSDELRGSRSGILLQKSEILCELLDTFRSFAEASDLALIKEFWTSECTFKVRFRALEAATVVARQFSDAQETTDFYAGVIDRLIEEQNALILLRASNPENGALLWSTVNLLLARLGDEALHVIEVAKKLPQTVLQIRGLTRKAKQALERSLQRRLSEDQESILQRLEQMLTDVSLPR